MFFKIQLPNFHTIQAIIEYVVSITRLVSIQRVYRFICPILGTTVV